MRIMDRAVLYVAVCVGLGLLVRMSLSPAAMAAGAEDADDLDGPAIAVCALPALLNEMMASDRFLPDREALEEELNEGIESLMEQRRELYDELQGMTPEDPDAQQKFQEFQTISRQYEQAAREAQRKIDQLQARQIREGYALIRSSADAVAADLGYNYVLASGDPNEELDEESPATVLRQLMARPVIAAPEGADITDDVREDLNL